MRKFFTVAGNCIFVIVIIYLCYFVMASAYHKTPSLLGYRLLRVISDSMEPVFGEGDCIIIKSLEEDTAAVGEIITFISEDPMLGGAYNTHRIYDMARDSTTGDTIYYTKGDNNSWQDEYVVTKDRIIGRYIGKLPYGKGISAFLDKLSERNFYFLIVIVPIVLCLTSCIIQLLRELRRK